MKKNILFIFVIVLANIAYGNDTLSSSKKNILGANFYYNNHNQYFKTGVMLDVTYEHVFNRWIGLQTSLGFNRAKVKLNDWKKDVQDQNYDYKYPSLTSGILFNIVGNFYAINNVKHKLKFGFGLEYRNITDAITIGVFDPLPQTNDETLYPSTSFEQYNDLGISGNMSYQFILKKGIGINTTFGYNHYFTDISKRAKEGDRVGGSSFIKLGIGIIYCFY
jgi:hypothetical protein